MWSSQRRINSVSKIRMPYRLHQRVISSPTISPLQSRTQCCDGSAGSLSESTITSPVQATEISTTDQRSPPCSCGNESDQSLEKASAAPSLIYTGVSLPSSTTNDMGHELGGRRGIRRVCVSEH